MQDVLTLQPITSFSGTLHLPGSKSVSNRALLLAALAKGTTRLTNLLYSDDVRYMLEALKALGIHYQLSHDHHVCDVQGVGGALTLKNPLELYLGNAGTAMRSLTAVLSLTPCRVVLTGEPRMKERPIGHLVEALRQGGSVIDYLEQSDYPPLRIQGGFKGGYIEVDGTISSQFLTSLLIMAPLAENDTEIHIIGDLVSKPYIDITLAMINSFGGQISHENYQCFYIKGNQYYQSPGDYLVEGDASSASYFLAAAAIKGGTVKVTGIGKNSLQGDIHFADILEEMGAKIRWENDFIECTRGELVGIDRDMNHIPDAAMTIAVTALFAKGETVIRNIYNWRVKETDRLYAMATELRKIGAEVEEGRDYLCITPPSSFQYAEIDTYNDHRMAMCFSLIALSDSAVKIRNPSCTSKTFPDYFEKFMGMSHATIIS